MNGMNPFDEWKSMRCFRGAADHDQCAVSSVAGQLSLSTAGWWKITTGGDAFVSGPMSTYAAVTSTTGLVLWERESWFVYCSAAPQYMSVIGHSGITGLKAYADRVKGL